MQYRNCQIWNLDEDEGEKIKVSKNEQWEGRSGKTSWREWQLI